MYNMTVKHDPYLNIHVDSYILTTDDTCVWIDGGLYGQLELAQEVMQGRQTTLLSTHGHWDHIGMHAAIQKMGGRVLANIGDKIYFEDHDWHWQELFGQFMNDADIPPARRETYVARVGSPMTPEYGLEDGEIVKLGDMTFEVIAIPGHSLGSVCFLEKNTGALFTGDGLIGHGFFTGTPQYMHVPKYLNSMEKLKKVACETVYSDHNPPMAGSLLAAKAQEGIDTCMSIDEAVRGYVAAHAAQKDLSLRELNEAVRVKVNRGVGAGTLISILAHLETIENPPECVTNCLARYIHGI